MAADTKIQQNTPTDYHRENAIRRTRWIMVFAILAVLFLVIIILNVNTGNVDISVGPIQIILFTKSGNIDEVNIICRSGNCHVRKRRRM